MKILGFDISSTCTGWAFYDSKAICSWKWGKINAPIYFRGLAKNNLLCGKALFWFCKRIRHIVRHFKPDAVCAEDINIRHLTVMRTMAQFHAAASIATSIVNPEKVLEKVHNATVRSTFKIRGKNAVSIKEKIAAKKNKVDITKVQMVDAVNDLLKSEISYPDHDTADAIAIVWTYFIKVGKR